MVDHFAKAISAKIAEEKKVLSAENLTPAKPAAGPSLVDQFAKSISDKVAEEKHKLGE